MDYGAQAKCHAVNSLVTVQGAYRNERLIEKGLVWEMDYLHFMGMFLVHSRYHEKDNLFEILGMLCAVHGVSHGYIQILILSNAT